MTDEPETLMTADMLIKIVDRMAEAFDAVPAEYRGEKLGEFAAKQLTTEQHQKVASLMRVIAVVATGYAEELANHGPFLLGQMPDKMNVLNLLTALDATRLSKDTLFILAEDCSRLFVDFDGVPRHLLEAFQEFAGEGAPEADDIVGYTRLPPPAKRH